MKRANVNDCIKENEYHLVGKQNKRESYACPL